MNCLTLVDCLAEKFLLAVRAYHENTLWAKKRHYAFGFNFAEFELIFTKSETV